MNKNLNSISFLFFPRHFLSLPYPTVVPNPAQLVTMLSSLAETYSQGSQEIIYEAFLMKSRRFRNDVDDQTRLFSLSVAQLSLFWEPVFFLYICDESLLSHRTGSGTKHCCFVQKPVSYLACSALLRFVHPLCCHLGCVSLSSR